MSQLKEYKHDWQDPSFNEIKSFDQMVEFFISCEKSKQNLLLGCEAEMFICHKANKMPIAYEGNAGIEHILTSTDWNLIKDNNKVIALSKGNDLVALEPGGQIEFAFSPQKTVYQVKQKITEYKNSFYEICDNLDLGFYVAGLHPKAKISQMARVPKLRYNIMCQYMPQQGKWGFDMMYRSCALQYSFDYTSEKNMIDLMRTAFMCTPFITLLFANSPFVESQKMPYLSKRVLAWHGTDNNRCGIPEFIFDNDFGYEKWVNFVLDVPMYFIRRDKNYHDLSGMSFRHFLKHGYNGFTAVMRDFIDHLTTVFTEARLKNVVEVRCMDAGNDQVLLAGLALWKGLLYNNNSIDKIKNLLDFTSQELTQMQLEMMHYGFNCKIRDKSPQYWLREILSIAKDGLVEMDDNEDKYLSILQQVVDSKTTFAEMMKDPCDMPEFFST